jgi:hypothetical protein
MTQAWPTQPSLAVVARQTGQTISLDVFTPFRSSVIMTHDCLFNGGNRQNKAAAAAAREQPKPAFTLHYTPAWEWPAVVKVSGFLKSPSFPSFFLFFPHFHFLLCIKHTRRALSHRIAVNPRAHTTPSL